MWFAPKHRKIKSFLLFIAIYESNRMSMCMYLNIYLTPRPIWFSFTVKLCIIQGKVNNYFVEGYIQPSKRNRTWKKYSPHPQIFQLFCCPFYPRCQRRIQLVIYYIYHNVILRFKYAVQTKLKAMLIFSKYKILSMVS